jgi:hypothetical protein
VRQAVACAEDAGALELGLCRATDRLRAARGRRDRSAEGRQEEKSGQIRGTVPVGHRAAGVTLAAAKEKGGELREMVRKRKQAGGGQIASQSFVIYTCVCRCGRVACTP